MSVPPTPGAAASPLVPPRSPPPLYNAEISHDGRWIAYQSDESGRFEVFVHPFPANRQGTLAGFIQRRSLPIVGARWTGIVFHRRQGNADVGAGSAGHQLHPGPEVPLFAAGHYFVDTARDYDLTKDGSRFLFVKNVTAVPRPSVVVVSNWFNEVRAKMGAR